MVAKKRVKPGTSCVAERKAAFVVAYLANGGNAAQAAITAGYAARSARVTGSRLLADANIKQQVANVAAKTAKIAGLDAARTLREVARIAYGDPRKLYGPDGNLKPIHELDDDEAALVASVEIDELTLGRETIGLTKKIKCWDKNAALEKAMKYHGHYLEDNTQKRTAIMINMDFRGGD